MDAFFRVIALANLKTRVTFLQLQLLVMVGFTASLMTAGLKLWMLCFDLQMPKLSKPGAELSLAIILCLLSGIFTEWLGISAIFGAFLMGVTG
jgi:Kef-type K+ transport system membrane component KefB